MIPTIIAQDINAGVYSLPINKTRKIIIGIIKAISNILKITFINYYCF